MHKLAKWLAVAVVLASLHGCSATSFLESRATPETKSDSTSSESVAIEDGDWGEPSVYRVASWNVRNLFDTVDDSYGDEVLTSGEYAQKIRALANVLDQVNADFIGLQEIENVTCLADLNSQLTKPYPQIGLIEGNDHGRGIDVAFMSRIPLSKVVSHADHTLPNHPDVSARYQFSRDCLEIQLATNPRLTILVNHLKSSRGDAKNSAAKRRVQSEGIMEIVGEMKPSPQRPVIVLGDFNDRPESWALEPLFEGLNDPFQQLPEKERTTHRYRGGGGILDHVLLSPSATTLVSGVRVWSSIAKKTSDHNPVSVDLTMSLPLGEVTDRIWTTSDN